MYCTFHNLNTKSDFLKIEHLTKQLKSASYLVIDGNLHEEFIKELANFAAGVKPAPRLVYEPVSMTKGLKILRNSMFHKFFLIKPNLHELYAMYNYSRVKEGKTEAEYSEGII